MAKSTVIDSAALRAMVRKHPVFEDFFRTLASRSRNSSVTELNRFLDSNDLEAVSGAKGRAQAVEFFRGLESLGLGHFRVGRRKKPTRFLWSAPLTEVANAALGEQTSEPDAQQPQGIRARVSHNADQKLLTHTYVLRQDLIVHLNLPADLTAAEAKRLSTFIETLPLDVTQGERNK